MKRSIHIRDAEAIADEVISQTRQVRQEMTVGELLVIVGKLKRVHAVIGYIDPKNGERHA